MSTFWAPKPLSWFVKATICSVMEGPASSTKPSDRARRIATSPRGVWMPVRASISPVTSHFESRPRAVANKLPPVT